MTKRRPPKLDRDPPWMRLGPAGDEPEETGNGERLWRKIAEGVTPLAKTKHRRNARLLQTSPDAQPAAAKSESEAPKHRAAESSRRAILPAKSIPRPAPAGPPALVPGQFAGIDRSSSEKFRKGKMAVDAKLDLHGMTQNQAHSAVSRFVASQHAAGARCVLIVTGKGKAGDPFAPKSAPQRFTMSSSRGVLKDALPRWLNEPGLRPYILAISPAGRGHGREGAMYVLLKRKR